jgi:hypothetical protein
VEIGKAQDEDLNAVAVLLIRSFATSADSVTVALGDVE